MCSTPRIKEILSKKIDIETVATCIIILSMDSDESYKSIKEHLKKQDETQAAILKAVEKVSTNLDNVVREKLEYRERTAHDTAIYQERIENELEGLKNKFKSDASKWEKIKVVLFFSENPLWLKIIIVAVLFGIGFSFADLIKIPFLK